MDTVWTAVVVVATIGVSTLVWATAGALRVLAALRPAPPARPRRFSTADVAILIAAHDEEPVIAETIRSAATQVTAAQVFVVCDGCSDGTAAVARAHGATVLELHPNRGKAGALKAGISMLGLVDRFAVVMLLDADTRLRDDYLESGLPQFDDADVVAVAGRATTHHDASSASGMGRFLTSYRERTYLCTQYLQKFGQAARLTDAVAIVPGFASMYRTDVVGRIDIDAPGLSIEDFNMTFEVHRKRLGRIAFHPSRAVAITQDPVTLGEYTRQVRRWSLGFWQTVRRHGLHTGVFWTSVGVFVAETVASSVVLLVTPAVIAIAAVASAVAGVPGTVGDVAGEIVRILPPGLLLAGFFVTDLALTLVAALLSRTRPPVSALLFPLMRLVDAAICLRALGAAFGRPSDGRWRSPARRPTPSSTLTP